MKIAVVQGVGCGSTTLSAFDSALSAAGIAHFNLIKMSSVIPAHSQIVIGDADTIWRQEWYSERLIGARLYVVLADVRAGAGNRSIGCGLGWCQDSTGTGVFVEHTCIREGDAQKEIESELSSSITQSLEELRRRRKWQSPEATCPHVVLTQYVETRPTAAIIAAVYGYEEWHQAPLIQ